MIALSTKVCYSDVSLTFIFQRGGALHVYVYNMVEKEYEDFD